MMKERLKKTQPIVYRTLYQAFNQNKIPHAYLLCSKKGVDMHEVAMYIVKSLICQEDVLACETCQDCQRIASKNYVDFISFDGKEESIKKKHIEAIQEEFSKSSMEGKAKVYLLENIDYATPEAMNSLLKTLEEPTPGIYAILTCENQNRVLPTIQSRTQTIHFRSISQKALAEMAIQEGVNEEDAAVLASIFDSLEQIQQKNQEESYRQLKVEALNFAEDYFTKRDNLLINAQTHVFKDFNQKEDIQFFLDLLLVLFKDLLYHAYGLDIAYKAHLPLISSFQIEKEEVMKVIEKILETKEAIKSNANLMLLMDRFVYEL